MPHDPAKLRSRAWFAEITLDNVVRRAFLKAEGFALEGFAEKPLIGICNSWSEYNNCNAHLRHVAEAVKRGVWAAGGIPLEFPTISLGEMFMLPTTMLYRNLMAMDVEESIRANPMDGVVLLCGCDKTTPAQIMGAASVDIPAIVVTGGPMLGGSWRNQRLGSGGEVRKLFDLYRVGELTEEQLCQVECSLARSPGHCGVMGTASTMACIAEALGITLPGAAAIPAVDSRRLAIAEASGRRIVDMVWEDLRPSTLMTRAAFENAITVDMAIGGSTNAVIHLIAIARRLGVPLSFDDFDRISRCTPHIANIIPSGEYIMEDFFAAGGVPAVMKEVLHLLHGSCMTANGQTVARNVATAECYNRDVLRGLANPLHAEGGTAILYGNLAPDGAVIKQTAASPHLLKHRGPAYVFENYADMQAQIDREDLPVTPDSILVMKNVGPKGAPGMPEWGHIPMPKILLQQGIDDMVRISDTRMSGTGYGTIVLHVAPESAIGGPLAGVRTGDEIELDVPNRTLNVCIADSELSGRLAQFTPPANPFRRGYRRLFVDHVAQANHGCDFDFLQ